MEENERQPTALLKNHAICLLFLGETERKWKRRGRRKVRFFSLSWYGAHIIHMPCRSFFYSLPIRFVGTHKHIHERGKKISILLEINGNKFHFAKIICVYRYFDGERERGREKKVKRTEKNSVNVNITNKSVMNKLRYNRPVQRKRAKATHFFISHKCTHKNG